MFYEVDKVIKFNLNYIKYGFYHNDIDNINKYINFSK